MPIDPPAYDNERTEDLLVDRDALETLHGMLDDLRRTIRLRRRTTATTTGWAA